MNRTKEINGCILEIEETCMGMVACSDVLQCFVEVPFHDDKEKQNKFVIGMAKALKITAEHALKSCQLETSEEIDLLMTYRELSGREKKEAYRFFMQHVSDIANN